MALSSIAAALTQFNANADWYGSIASAQLRLEAVEYLLVNRPTKQDDQGSSLDFESLQKMQSQLTAFLGAGVPRAFGRKRRVGVAYPPVVGLK